MEQDNTNLNYLENNLNITKEKLYEKNINIFLKPKINIYQYIYELELDYLLKPIFHIFSVGFDNNKVIIINSKILEFISCKKNDYICVLKKQNIKIDLVEKNNNLFDVFNFFNDIYTNYFYVISFNEIKKLLYMQKKIDFKKIYYVKKLENLFEQYAIYISSGILFHKEKKFLKDNFTFSNNAIFLNFWNCIKNNKNIIINHHILNLLNFNIPCLPTNFKKDYNEEMFFKFLIRNEIPFEEINYKDERCLDDEFAYQFILCHNNNKIKKKTWIVLDLHNFKILLNKLHDKKIFDYFNKVFLLHEKFLNFIE